MAQPSIAESSETGHRSSCSMVSRAPKASGRQCSQHSSRPAIKRSPSTSAATASLRRPSDRSPSINSVTMFVPSFRRSISETRHSWAIPQAAITSLPTRDEAQWISLSVSEPSSLSGRTDPCSGSENVPPSPSRRRRSSTHFFGFRRSDDSSSGEGHSVALRARRTSRRRASTRFGARAPPNAFT